MNAIISKEEFEELSPDCQNVWLAKDILHQIDRGLFKPFQGNTLFNADTEYSLDDGDEMGKCYGCAVGAALYSRCMILSDGVYSRQAAGERWQAFGSESDAIECYFECRQQWDRPKHNAMSAEDRLRFICRNLIENNGKFLPGEPGEGSR